MVVEERFRFEQFLKGMFRSIKLFNDSLLLSSVDQPVEWQIFLKDVIYTQAFSQFVDDRVLFEKLDKGKVRFTTKTSLLNAFD